MESNCGRSTQKDGLGREAWVKKLEAAGVPGAKESLNYEVELVGKTKFGRGEFLPN